MPEERRRVVRRASDRELLQQWAALKSNPAAISAEDRERELRHRRRRAIRHHCQVHLALKVAHVSAGGNEWNVDIFPIKGRLLDLSASGGSLFTSQPMNIGQDISLVIGLREGATIRATGTIRWTKGVPERNGYASGVRFGSMSDKGKDMIAAFLRELDTTIGL